MIMRLLNHKFVLGCLIYGFSVNVSSQESDQINTPLCLKNDSENVTITLLGVSHALPVGDRQLFLENQVNRSTHLFLENRLPFQKDANGQPTLSRKGLPTLRLDSFVDTNDIPTLSNILGVALSPDRHFPLIDTINIFSAIFSKALRQTDASKNEKRGLPKHVANASTVEAAAYLYAISKNVPTYDLEEIPDTLGASDLDTIKSEVSTALRCSSDAVCIANFKKNNALLWRSMSESTTTYDEVYLLVMDIPTSERATLARRNERMFNNILPVLSNGSRALVIVGAAHISGPTGLASKLETANFTKVKCSF